MVGWWGVETDSFNSFPVSNKPRSGIPVGKTNPRSASCNTGTAFPDSVLIQTPNRTALHVSDGSEVKLTC